MDNHQKADDIDPETGKPRITSSGKFWGWGTIYGVEGEHSTPYLSRAWFGRLRIHIFHRADKDPDCHDHPWAFWTFPLTPYVEEVVSFPTGPWPNTCDVCEDTEHGCIRCTLSGWFNPAKIRRQIVPAFRVSYRPATHCHRVLGRYAPGVTEFTMDGEDYSPSYRAGKVITIVWRGREGRNWGFLRNRDGKWCWTPWKEYVFGGGKDAPCS